MTEQRHYKEPDPTPMYICLALAIGVCAWFFFIGFTCVRLWFYQGALGKTTHVRIVCETYTDFVPTP